MLQKMIIKGGTSLKGIISISGAKNLALPATVVTLLTDQKLTLNNVPDLVDIHSSINLLGHLGTNVDWAGKHTLSLSTSTLKTTEAPYDFVRKMRASVLVLGPLTARFKKALVSLPGGCAIGTRGIDLHVNALRQLGVEVELENGCIKTSVPSELKGSDINFPYPTVTGTENTLMAAVLAKGTTKLINAAMEPEVIELANLLNQMGAKIEGQGSSVVTIEGVDSLHGTTFDITPDRIEAGTYAIAAAATNGEILLKGCRHDHLSSFWEALSLAGVAHEKTDEGVLIKRGSNEIMPVDIQTMQYPGFPTDLQAQFMTLMTICNGTASITENIFENRFMHVPELMRMGADISTYGKTAVVKGVNKLKGAQVMATDLRASVSLVIAGLMAEGETTVNRLYHLDRGYEKIEEKLINCGANVERVSIT